MLTLAFLAIWHGFYVGYFFCFTMEFVIVHVERQVCLLLVTELHNPVELPRFVRSFVVGAGRGYAHTLIPNIYCRYPDNLTELKTSPLRTYQDS